MIKTFRVQNYKALRDVTLNLTPIHLLIGPNDSGKTSITESIGAVCRSVDQPLSSTFPGRWIGQDLVTNREQGASVTFTCVMDNDDGSYRLAIGFKPIHREPFVDTEEFYFGGQSLLYPTRHFHRTSVFRYEHEKREIENEIRNRTPDGFEVGNWLTVLSRTYHKLSGVDLFRWNARLLATPTALDPKAGFRMQASGFGLARVLDAILSHDRELFMDLERRFKEYFPNVSALRLKSTDAYSTPSSLDELVPKLNESPGKEIAVQFKSSHTDVPASQLSEGMLLILGYLAVMYSPEPPRVLLIEEPENGLHPDRLKDVISMLRQLITSQSHTQVILTSHSPYIVSLFQPEEVTLCRKNTDGYVEVKRLSDSELVKQQLDVFSLGEIWPAEEEAIFSESAPEPVAEAPQ